jgi:hypothetical protein
MPEVTAEDAERVELLRIVSSSKIGLKILSKEQRHDVEALISKIDLLKKINNRLYDLEEGRIIL